MTPPAAVLFDLDGTLLDTARDLGNTLNHLLSQAGLPMCTYEQYRPVASHGANGLLQLGFGEALKNFDAAALRREFLAHYDQNICVDTCLFAGMTVFLEHLRERQIPWGIVTNKPGALTNRLLPYFMELQDCATVVSGDTLPKRKPDPDPLLHAANEIDIDPNGIWYVGDAERDIQAANAAGMISILAEYGYLSAQDDVENWAAHHRVVDVESLSKLLVG